MVETGPLTLGSARISSAGLRFSLHLDFGLHVGSLGGPSYKGGWGRD